jgi:hypothetical protein
MVKVLGWILGLILFSFLGIPALHFSLLDTVESLLSFRPCSRLYQSIDAHVQRSFLTDFQQNFVSLRETLVRTRNAPTIFIRVPRLWQHWSYKFSQKLIYGFLRRFTCFNLYDQKHFLYALPRSHLSISYVVILVNFFLLRTIFLFIINFTYFMLEIANIFFFALQQLDANVLWIVL